jgi:hypothetical protein
MFPIVKQKSKVMRTLHVETDSDIAAKTSSVDYVVWPVVLSHMENLECLVYELRMNEKENIQK